MPSSSAGSEPRGTEREAGYVLVEMVATLAITALLIAFVFPNVPRTSSAPRLAGLVADTVSLLRDARSRAIGSGRPVTAEFDPRARTLRTGTARVSLPVDLHVSLLAGGRCPTSASRAGIEFRPDGTNCGGVLRLAQGTRVTRVRVDWLDGRVDVLQGE
jgi:general secretion pathway protein H